MTEAQANEIVVILSAATGGRAHADTRSYFEAQLPSLDYQTALSTATMGTITWRSFPSWAEFREMYRAQQKLHEPSGEQRMNLPKMKETKIPLWVRRWTAARFLYERFGKDQDFRRFGEQGDYADPMVPLMPDEEWTEEAKHVADKEVWKAVGS